MFDDVPNIVSLRLAVPNAAIKLFVTPHQAGRTLAKVGWMNSITVVACPQLLPPIASSRFSCYLDEIKVEDTGAKIAMVDVGDVWIIRDIFQKIQQPLYVVTEPASMTMAQDRFHNEWISGCPAYGTQVWDKVKNNPMICAGTIFGTVSESLINSMTIFTSEIESTKCNDQGVLNVLVRTGRVFPAIWRHEEGIVLSMNVDPNLANYAEPYVLHTGDNPKSIKAAQAMLSKMYGDMPALASEFRPILSEQDQAASESLLAHIDKVCREHRIRYIIDGGTLIGSLLHMGPIPWDDDIDILIEDENRDKAMRLLSTDGYTVRNSYNGLYSKLWDTSMPHVDNGQTHNWPFVDIGWLEQNATHAWEKRIKGKEVKYSGHVYPLETLFPETERPYGSLTLKAPRNGDQMLESIHGPKWRENCVKGNWDHRLEKIRDSRLGHRDNVIKVPCLKLPWVPIAKRVAPNKEVLYLNKCKLKEVIID